MTKELQAIARARNLISDPDKWCQGAQARASDGFETPALNPDACSWCAWGALISAAYDLTGHPRDATLLANNAACLLHEDIVDFGITVLFSKNDNEGHAAVLALFDKALQAEAA